MGLQVQLVILTFQGWAQVSIVRMQAVRLAVFRVPSRRVCLRCLIQENTFWMDRILRAYQSRLYQGDLADTQNVRGPARQALQHHFLVHAWKSPTGRSLLD